MIQNRSIDEIAGDRVSIFLALPVGRFDFEDRQTGFGIQAFAHLR